MLQKLNIGLVLPAVSGHSETFIKNKINGLLEHGYKVSLYVGGNVNSNKIHESIPIYYQVDVNNKFHLLFTLITTFILHPLTCIRFFNLEKLSHGSGTKAVKNLIINSHIIRRPLDWIHFEFATMGIYRENVAKAMGIKSAVSLRGFDIGLYPHEHPGCYNLLWKKIDRVHTISDDLYQKAVKIGLDTKTLCTKITPAINTEFFKSNSIKNLHNPLRILTVGRLTWKKGYEYALKALSLLKNKQINFEYHIVGEGNHREAIIYAIHKLGLTEDVKLRGQLSHQKVKQEMKWAEIYIQPSIQEGFCNAVLEAQAMGLLCIVTNAEGLSENVLDGKTGWVVPKRSSEAITEQIIKIKNMEMLQYNKIRENAIVRVKDHFYLNEQIQNWSDFYKYD